MNDLNIKFRSEEPKDYAQIAELQYLAFDNEEFMGETILIDVLRHRESFDPELSLVAVLDNRIIGHILFNPFTLYHKNEEIPAVNLAPVSVHPDFQKRGIGKQLIEIGHRQAVEKGYKLSFLWGHPEYYPRYGYKKKAFYQGGVKLNLAGIPDYNDELKLRNPRCSDLPQLIELWKKNFSDSGLSIFPGDSIVDWVSHTKNVKTKVVKVEDKIKGYLRYNKGSENKPTMLLADDDKTLLTIISYLKSEIEGEITEFILPLHPNSNPVKKIKNNISYTVNLVTHEAFMINYLTEDISKNVKEKRGLFILPPHFDVA